MPGDDSTSHASRNPARAVQTARQRKKLDPKDKPTPAEKASRAIIQAEKKIAEEAFNDDVDAFFALRGQTIVQLATKHNLTADYVKDRLIQTSQYKAERAPSLRGAPFYCHYALTTNIVLPDGNALHLPELHRRTDIIMMDTDKIDPEDKRVWLEDLLEHRSHQRVGLRATNKAAAGDIRALANRLEKEALTAYERTGCRIIMMLTRGHIDDEAMPCSIESGGAGEFFVEMLKKPFAEIMQMYELWSCNRSHVRDTRASMQSQTSKLAEDGLRKIKNNATLTVSYKNFDVECKEAHGVHIVGWPADIPFVCPSQVKTVERVRRLRDGWLGRTIRWDRMSDEQVADLAEDLAARRATATDGLLITRKQRSDLGGEHSKAAMGKK
ncbi:hypothetical protein C8R43DRAFT_904908, partial [Mycena crocata]